MSPDFQAPTQPAMDWLPMEQDQTAGNMSNIVDQLKQRQTKLPSLGGKGTMPMGATGKAGARGSL